MLKLIKAEVEKRGLFYAETDQLRDGKIRAIIDNGKCWQEVTIDVGDLNLAPEADVVAAELEIAHAQLKKRTEELKSDAAGR